LNETGKSYTIDILQKSPLWEQDSESSTFGEMSSHPEVELQDATLTYARGLIIVQDNPAN
jgi:hypothetical protein